MKKMSFLEIIMTVIIVVAGIIFNSMAVLFIGIGFGAGIAFSGIVKMLDKKIFIKNEENKVIEEDKKIVKYNSKIEEKFHNFTNEFKEFSKIEVFKETSSITAVQLERTNEKFERFIYILNEKFSPEELAYSKFFATVEQVYAVILENIEKIEYKFQGMGGKDYDYLVKRLEMIENLPSHTHAQLDEMSAIRQKKGMVKKELKAISEIISINEGVISSLDKILIETSNIKTESSTLDVSADFARKELEELIKNAKQYNIY